MSPEASIRPAGSRLAMMQMPAMLVMSMMTIVILRQLGNGIGVIALPVMMMVFHFRLLAATNLYRREVPDIVEPDIEPGFLHRLRPQVAAATVRVLVDDYSQFRPSGLGDDCEQKRQCATGQELSAIGLHGGFLSIRCRRSAAPENSPMPL
jgi:hypothetical protein